MGKFEHRLKKLETRYRSQEERLTNVQNLLYARLPELERRLTGLQAEVLDLQQQEESCMINQTTPRSTTIGTQLFQESQLLNLLPDQLHGLKRPGKGILKACQIDAARDETA